jgi:hypothetical protein
MYRFIPFVLLLMLFSLCTGCSKGSSENSAGNDFNNPLLPTVDYGNDSDSGRVMLGQWKVTIDPVNKTASAIKTRSCMEHIKIDDTLVSYLILEPIFPEVLWPEFWVEKSLVWNFDMRLIRPEPSSSLFSFYNIRAILELMPTAGMQVLGLQNSDGQTTLWSDTHDFRPFKAFYVNDLPYSLLTQNFQVLTTPWDSIHGLPEFTFTLDGSINEPCDDPLSIRFVQSVVPYKNPGGGQVTAAYQITVADYDNDIVSIVVSIEDVYFVDGAIENTIRSRIADVEYTFTGSPYLGPVVHTFQFDNLDREALVKLKIEAYSELPLNPDPETDPNVLVKYVVMGFGNFDELVHQWFHPDITVFNEIKQEILNEWAIDSHPDHRNITPGYDIYPLSLVEVCVDNPEPKEWFDDATYYLLKHPIRDRGPGGVLPPDPPAYFHYGAVRVPHIQYKPAAGWPILVLTHYGSEVHPVHPTHDIYPDTPITNLADYQNHMCNDFIQVFPSYRGNTLHWPGTTYHSGPESIISTGDWEVDDTLVYLHLLLTNDSLTPGATPLFNSETLYFTDIADTSKVVMMGGSRGGIPTYLGKLRDLLDENYYIDAGIVEFGSGTDLFLTDDLQASGNTPIEQSLLSYIFNINYLESIDFYTGYFWEPLPLGLGLENHYFNEDYLVFKLLFEAYMSDYSPDPITIRDGVKRMLRSSPKWFVHEPMSHYGKLQVHHGIYDPLARYQHAEILATNLGINTDNDVIVDNPGDPFYPPIQILKYGEMQNNHIPVEYIGDDIIPVVPDNVDQNFPTHSFWDYMSDLLNWVRDEAD